MDSINKWKNNGLQRKGWKLIDFEEDTNLGGECEWCGTALRYIHWLNHPERPGERHSAGCVCAEHLAEDYISPHQREATHKGALRWARYARLEISWRENERGNYVLRCKGKIYTVIPDRQGKYTWVSDGVFHNKLPSFAAAREEMARDVLRQL